jgi:hypothetical protein
MRGSLVDQADQLAVDPQNAAVASRICRETGKTCRSLFMLHGLP